jgi:hypothetical protein
LVFNRTALAGALARSLAQRVAWKRFATAIVASWQYQPVCTLAIVAAGS